jgi:UDP:flavonoid glycosyltransferase YjiC (YdhE family)
MVSNGGYNGAKMALAHGVPLVIAPWGNDQPDVAGRIAWAGAAVDLRVRTPGPAAIRAAVEAVLRESAYRDAASRISAEFARYPGGERAADLLEKLAV